MDETLAGSGEPPRGGPPTDMPLGRGNLVGRYVVLSRIGRGAMGSVFLAYDPELDRKVAIKLLVGAAEDAAHARLLHEARALAKLRHPNVVGIHDVGIHDRQVFLAMQLVEGVTLGKWLAETRPRFEEILRVYRAAGEGLAAAHQAGLVHRDFKPDNVMIDGDGRVVVLDFGLARRLDADLEKRLTIPGQLMGTPAYMAPEQHEIGEVGPAADQFAFCVSLWEALYGERPYPGETMLALLFAIENGQLRAPRPEVAVPAWVRRVIERGLARRGEDRYPDMRTLLSALRRGDPKRRRRPWLAATGFALLVVGGVIGFRTIDGARRTACAERAADLEPRWSDEWKGKVEAGFSGTALPFAAASFDLVVPWIERRIAEHEDLEETTCLAVLDGRISPPLFAARTQCLAERRAELEALVDALAAADESLVTNSVTVAAQLSPIDTCRTPPMQADAAASRARADLLRELAAIRVLVEIDSAEAKKRAEGTLERSLELADPLVEARARLVLGQALDATGEYDLARAEFESAFASGIRLGLDEVVIEAGTKLLFLVGYRKAEFETGLVFGRVAESGLEAMGAPPEDLRRAELLHARAIVALHLGRADEALADQERSLEIRERVLGSHHPFVAASLNSLAATLHRKGALEEARDTQQRALDVTMSAYGPAHVRVAAFLQNLAQTEFTLGDTASALAHLESALLIMTVHRGGEHPDLGPLLAGIGANHYALGEREVALEFFERALRIGEGHLDPDHPSLATMLDNVGALEHELGRLERAEALHERSLAIRERKFPGQPILARSLDNLGRVTLDAGQPERALELHARALEILTDADPPDELELGAALVGSGRAMLATGDEVEGLARIERGITLWEGRPDTKDSHDIAVARFALARAIVGRGPEAHTRAMEIAAAARRSFARPGHADELARIDEWLAAHEEGGD